MPKKYLKEEYLRNGEDANIYKVSNPFAQHKFFEEVKELKNGKELYNFLGTPRKEIYLHVVESIQSSIDIKSNYYISVIKDNLLSEDFISFICNQPKEVWIKKLQAFRLPEDSQILTQDDIRVNFESWKNDPENIALKERLQKHAQRSPVIYAFLEYFIPSVMNELPKDLAVTISVYEHELYDKHELPNIGLWKINKKGEIIAHPSFHDEEGLTTDYNILVTEENRYFELDSVDAEDIEEYSDVDNDDLDEMDTNPTYTDIYKVSSPDAPHKFFEKHEELKNGDELYNFLSTTREDIYEYIVESIQSSIDFKSNYYISVIKNNLLSEDFISFICNQPKDIWINSQACFNLSADSRILTQDEIRANFESWKNDPENIVLKERLQKHAQRSPVISAFLEYFIPSEMNGLPKDLAQTILLCEDEWLNEKNGLPKIGLWMINKEGEIIPHPEFDYESCTTDYNILVTEENKYYVLDSVDAEDIEEYSDVDNNDLDEMDIDPAYASMQMSPAMRPNINPGKEEIEEEPLIARVGQKRKAETSNNNDESAANLTKKSVRKKKNVKKRKVDLKKEREKDEEKQKTGLAAEKFVYKKIIEKYLNKDAKITLTSKGFSVTYRSKKLNRSNVTFELTWHSLSKKRTCDIELKTLGELETYLDNIELKNTYAPMDMDVEKTWMENNQKQTDKRHIEVKGSVKSLNANPKFYLSGGQYRFIQKNRDKTTLYLVTDVDVEILTPSASKTKKEDHTTSAYKIKKPNFSCNLFDIKPTSYTSNFPGMPKEANAQASEPAEPGAKERETRIYKINGTDFLVINSNGILQALGLNIDKLKEQAVNILFNTNNPEKFEKYINMIKKRYGNISIFYKGIKNKIKPPIKSDDHDGPKKILAKYLEELFKKCDEDSLSEQIEILSLLIDIKVWKIDSKNNKELTLDKLLSSPENNNNNVNAINLLYQGQSVYRLVSKSKIFTIETVDEAVDISELEQEMDMNSNVVNLDELYKKQEENQNTGLAGEKHVYKWLLLHYLEKIGLEKDSHPVITTNKNGFTVKYRSKKEGNYKKYATVVWENIGETPDDTVIQTKADVENYIKGITPSNTTSNADFRINTDKYDNGSKILDHQERSIEVKTTKCSKFERSTLHLSEAERKHLEEKQNRGFLFHVFSIFGKPELTHTKDPTKTTFSSDKLTQAGYALTADPNHIGKYLVS